MIFLLHLVIFIYRTRRRG